MIYVKAIVLSRTLHRSSLNTKILHFNTKDKNILMKNCELSINKKPLKYLKSIL